MASNSRLRRINAGSKPISTMHNDPTTRSQDTISFNDERPPKRQKQGRSTGTESKFFITAKLPSGGRGSYLDLTDSGSQGQAPDKGDVWSVSSAGKSAGATAALAEYRKTASHTAVKSTGRRRRPRKPSFPGKQQNQPPIDLVERDSTPSEAHRGNARVEAGSSVISSPPPAKITSDIRSKRGRSVELVDSVQPAVKRPKKRTLLEEIESDDELSVQGPNPTQTNKRITNFSTIAPRLKNQTDRGDIQQTQFKSIQSAERGTAVVGSLQVGPEEVHIAKAVAGRHTYSPKGEETHIILRLGKVGALVPTEGSESARPFRWLTITPKKIHTVEHATTKSPYMIIKRTATDEAPSTLCLKFKTIPDAVTFFAWIYEFPAPKFVEDQPEQLEKTFNHIFSKTENYISQGSPPRISHETESRGLERSTQAKFDVSHLRESKPRDPFRPDANDPSADKPHKRASLVSEMNRTEGMETRRTRRTSPVTQYREPSPAPQRWTDLHPKWDENWHRSLVYPATGKNRTNVEKDDILRLDEGEFLNDNLINFYLRYLQDVQAIHDPGVLQTVYFFSTFFYAKLRSNRPKPNYEGVKSWTAKVDLLSYKYIVVPVNENAHWYLAVICNAPQTLPKQEEGNSADKGSNKVEIPDPRSSPGLSNVERDISFISLEDEPAKPRTRSDKIADISESSPSTITANQSQEALVKIQAKKSAATTAQKTDVNLPRIITLDSLGSAHSPTCRYLKEYLVQEAIDKKGIELSVLPSGMTAKNIPEQDNFCDCGVFILGYMQEFLKNPDEAIRRLLMKEDLGWEINPSVIRQKMRGILFTLQEEQEQRLVEEAKQKQERRERILKQRQRRAQAEQASAALEVPAAQTPQGTPKKAPSTPRETREGQSTPRAQGASKVNDVGPSVEREEKRLEETPSQISPLRSSPMKKKVATPVRGSKDAITPVHPSDEAASERRRRSSVHVFETAPISSAKKPRKEATVDLTASGEIPSQSAAVSSIEKPGDGFVRALSVTSTEVTPSRVKVNDRRTTSPEVTMVKRTHREIRVPAPHIERDTRVQLVPSIETDQPPSRPRYDGVDRSIDLTEASQ